MKMKTDTNHNTFAISASALKDDFVLILHQDRKEHRIMSYINLMEQLTLAEQEETVKFLCNMCGSPGSFDWLMYISEVSLRSGPKLEVAEIFHKNEI